MNTLPPIKPRINRFRTRTRSLLKGIVMKILGFKDSGEKSSRPSE
jgi:hypothetical protein